MFDPVTSALLRNAPTLDGLDIEGLPKRLTSAFANIVSARIRLRTAGETGEGVAFAETLAELRRVAAAHEVYVALLPERENRAAASFVAASAHQACMVGQAPERGDSRVDAAALSPEICSTLLFMVAEASAEPRRRRSASFPIPTMPTPSSGPCFLP